MPTLSSLQASFTRQKTRSCFSKTDFERRMSMSIYKSNQIDLVMTNTDMSTAPGSPDSLSQASTKFEPRQTISQSTPEDRANDVNSPVPGWPTLAKVMAQTPDFEAFASFKDLSIKSLLYYQAELIYLREELHKIEWEDNRQHKNDVKSRFADDLTKLIRARDRNPTSQCNCRNNGCLLKRSEPL
jgi:hypothetical protein